MIDNKNFIEEKEQCVYDCKLITLETNTIKSKRESNKGKNCLKFYDILLVTHHLCQINRKPGVQIRWQYKKSSSKSFEIIRG